jgi:hypothetical protein
MRAVPVCLMLALACAGCRESKKQVVMHRMERMNDLRILAGLLVAHGQRPPMKDGTLDVYYFVKKGDITRENYDILRRPGEDRPTDEEIERGDYTNFPYERYRGKGELDFTRPVPLLWDKAPDEHGVYVVGMSDGRAEAMDEAGLKAMLGR